MEIEHNQQEEMELDLMELIYLLLGHWKKIIATVLLGAILAFSATNLFVTPMYRSSSMIYVLTQTTSITSMADIQLGSQLALDFQILATSRPVVEAVIEELNLDVSYESLVRLITVENLSKSRILQISVEHKDPALAADISNALADMLSKRVSEIMITEKPTKVENAVVSTNPISPNKSTNTLIGGMLGGILICGFILLKFILDDTIKNGQDVEKYLKLNTLAEIPINPDNVADTNVKKNIFSKMKDAVEKKSNPHKIK